MRVPVALAALAVAAPVHAADFAVRSFSGPTPVISIVGDLEAGDDLKFTRFAAVLNTAIVELDSTGGRLAPALTIGDILSRKGFTTYVGPHATCSSACGLIWLAGKPRVKHVTAQIGFHAAYVADGAGINRENGLSNALVGAYMARLELGSEAVMFATAAEPGSMAWITPDSGSRYGIPFETVEDDLATLRTVDAAPSGADRTASLPAGRSLGGLARRVQPRPSRPEADIGPAARH